MIEIISVRFKSGGKEYYFNPNGIRFQEGDGVIVETTRGQEYAQCVRGNTMIDEIELTAPLRPVVRPATGADLAAMEQNREKEKKAMAVCQRKIAEHGLDMKLVSAEYSFDGSKVLFFFTSDGRVDFRALVKDLASTIHARIELRQIGVRDEAKMLGGLGICGKPFCCSSFLSGFQPVSIKMAKTQNLSLNPTKISGTCGRLMCCLKYEQEAYEDLMKGAPRMDSFVETPDGAGTIISVNTLREKARVRLDDAPDTLKTYQNSEIRVIRSGKGKRPEGYVQPPKEELAKLRRSDQSDEEQYRREQAQLAAALDQFMAEHQEPQPPAPGRRSRSHEGEEKHRRSRHHRSSRGGGQPQNPETAAHPHPPAAEEGGGEETARRRRSSRGRRSSSALRQEKPTPPNAAPQSPKSGEEKKSRPHWHRRGRRRGGEGGGGNPPANG